MSSDSQNTVSEVFAETSYDVKGPGSAIVLIHGLCLDRSSWSDAFVGQLSQGYQVVRYDLFGHGWSTKPPGEYLLDSFILQFDWLLEHLGISSYCLLGDGAGAILAFHYAATSQKISSILVLNYPYSRPMFGRNIPENLKRHGNKNTIEQAFRGSVQDQFSQEFYAKNPDLYQSVLKMLNQYDIFAYTEASRLFLNKDWCFHQPRESGLKGLVVGNTRYLGGPVMR